MKKAHVSRHAHADRQSFCMIVPSASLREIILHAYIKRGWKYFVKFSDVNGFGLQAVNRADWQDDRSSVSIQ